jgi:hypothetical protein
MLNCLYLSKLDAIGTKFLEFLIDDILNKNELEILSYKINEWCEVLHHNTNEKKVSE